jgi:hypothetical protein
VSIAFLALIAAPLAGETSFEVAAGLASPVRVAAADRLTELLPADAFLVVRARSIRTVIDDVNLLTGRSAGDAEYITTEKLLTELDAGVAEFAAQLDVDRPAGLAVRLEAGMQPAVWFALPTQNAEKLALALAGRAEPLTAIAAGDYLVVASQKDVTSPLGGCTVAAELAGSDLAAHVDLAALLGAFRPMVDMGLDQAEMEVTNEGGDEAAVASEYFDLTRDVLDSARGLRLQLDARANRIEIAGTFTVGEGTPLTKWFAGPRRDLGVGAGLLDTAAAFSMLSMSDPAGIGQRQLDWFETMAEAVPEKLRGLMQLETEVWREMQPKTTGLSAASLDFALEGLRASAFVESSDPASLIASMQRFLVSKEIAELGVVVSAPSQREVAGTPWTEYTIRMDLETLARFFDEQATIPPEDREEAERALALFLGEGGLRLGVAAVDRYLVTRVGGDDAFARSTAARVGAKPAGLGEGMIHALSRSTNAQAAWLFHADVGRLMNQFGDLASSLGQEIELPVELLGDSFPITAHAVVEGLEWRGGIEFDAGDLARFVRAMDEK